MTALIQITAETDCSIASVLKKNPLDNPRISLLDGPWLSKLLHYPNIKSILTKFTLGRSVSPIRGKQVIVILVSKEKQGIPLRHICWLVKE